MDEKTQGSDVYFVENTLIRIYNDLLYPLRQNWSSVTK